MNEPSTPKSADPVVVPFLPALRTRIGAKLSPPVTRLVVTDSGARSRVWRSVEAIWKSLVVFSAVAIVASTLASHPAHATEVPLPGAKDARVRNVTYDPDQVVSIQGSFRHAIEIQFGPSETITQAALGDTVSWQIAPVGNIIFLKPRERAGPTNLIVITSANGSPRTYHFNLTLGSGEAMYGVRFRYPREERALAALQAQLAQAASAKALETGITTSALDHAVLEGVRNMNYTVQGDAALQPTEISDNGEFTVLRYPGHADIPSIFAVDVDGTETIVPYDVREDFVVIHAVYRQLRLRRGTAVLCVFNEAPLRNDRGDRTGTVSNVVERKVKDNSMAETVIDRGGIVGADAISPGDPETVVARSGGWANIALIGAGIGLIGAVGGIAIGYEAFHRTAASTTAAEPAKASDRAVADVMGSPEAQRAQLANQLGQPGAPQTDIFGRPVAAPPIQPAVDGNGNLVPGSTATATSPSGGQETPAQRRAEQARSMADAARRSPIMAFGATGLASAASPEGASPAQAQPEASSRAASQSMVASQDGQGLGASGFGATGDAAGVASKGATDFTDQLAHSAIQTVRATMVADRNLLLSAGTVIPCTLQTAINSTQAGFVSCVINHDVYSENGRVVLLDKGTKVLGQYSGGITQGQARLFVLWTRALTPRGVAIDLGSPAADSLGRAGLPGGVDTQFWARFGVGLVISVLEDASTIASRAVAGQGTYTTEVPGNTAQTVLQNTMSIRPILKKNQGDTAAIFVAKDFDFRTVYDVRLRR